MLGDGALEAAEQFWKQTAERYEQRAHDVERPILPPAELYLSPEQLREALEPAQLRIELVDAQATKHAIAPGPQPAPDAAARAARAEGGSRRLQHFTGRRIPAAC